MCEKLRERFKSWKGGSGELIGSDLIIKFFGKKIKFN